MRYKLSPEFMAMTPSERAMLLNKMPKEKADLVFRLYTTQVGIGLGYTPSPEIISELELECFKLYNPRKE